MGARVPLEALFGWSRVSRVTLPGPPCRSPRYRRRGNLWVPGELPGRGGDRGLVFAPPIDYGYRFSSQEGVRPGLNFGDTITPGNNSKGTYVQLFTGAEVSCDLYGILLNINSNVAAGTVARDTIVDIGYDEAAGTSYTVKIPDLLASNAGSWAGTLDGLGGVWYYFPLFFPAGCTIAARASVNNATVSTLRVWAKIFGQPLHPEMTKVGQYCFSVGVVAASSRGTTVTPGTTSDGTYASLGTPTQSAWWWQVGFGVNDGTMSNLQYFLDIAQGDGSTFRDIIHDALVITSAGEAVGKPLAGPEEHQVVQENTAIYGRCQCSGTADSNISMAAYGVGG